MYTITSHNDRKATKDFVYNYNHPKRMEMPKDPPIATSLNLKSFSTNWAQGGWVVVTVTGKGRSHTRPTVTFSCTSLPPWATIMIDSLVAGICIIRAGAGKKANIHIQSQRYAD